MQRIRLGLLAVFLLVLAAAGCLEFDKQTVYFEHDQANDRLIMVIDYGGLYAEKANGKQDDSRSQQQLDEVVKGHQVALLNNWPFTWDPTRISTDRANPNSELAAGQKARLKRLAELVTVLNAGFYTDAAGRACGAQVVVVDHVSEAIDLTNGLINDNILAEEDRGPADRPDYDRLAIEAAHKGHKWVALDGNSLVVRVPMTEELLADGWQRVVRAYVKGEEGLSATVRNRFRYFLSTPMFMWFEDGTLSFRIGLPSKPFLLNAKPPEGRYEANLVDYIKTKYGFDLDARLAHYLEKPDAPAEEEADRAAKLMAPRLTPEQRARVLVGRLRTAPSDALWDLLRKTPAPAGLTLPPPTMPEEDLLRAWQTYLSKQAAGPDTESETDKTKPEPAAPEKAQ